jgi:hypothetical protein
LALEAIAPRLGEVHLRDLRAALGDPLTDLHVVDVVVVAEDGGAVAARIELTTIKSGPSARRLFVCPTCRAPAYLLFARRGALQCSRHQRTRRQLENHRADFRRRGGLEEDLLLRILLSPSRRRTRARLREAERLANLLLHDDHARVAVLRARLELLVVVVATT